MANALEAASLVMIPSGYEDGTLGSLKPTDGSGDFTFSRGSNLSATRINEQGYIEKGYENLLLQSNSFDTTWANINSTETSGQQGYDGSNDAWLLEKSAANGFIYQSISTSGVQVLSIYAKQNSANSIRFLVIAGVARAEADYNLSTGVVDSTSPSIIGSANIEDVGNGWYRCSFSVSFSLTTQLRIYPAENGSTSASSGSVYIQDAQINQGLVAYPYIETTTAPVAGGILEDMPRLDWSGSCPSLLLEPSRTNLIPHSEYFGAWDAIGSTQTLINDTNPVDGVAYEIKSSVTASDSRIYQSGLMTAGNDYSSSYLVKASSNPPEYLGFACISNTQPDVLYNFATDSFEDNTIVGNAAKCESISMNNGWKLLKVPVHENVNNTRFNIYQGSKVGSALKGTTGQSYYLKFAQLEQDATYPTSYIPTYGTSQTRLEDLATASDLINADNDFTFYFESTLMDEGYTNKYFDNPAGFAYLSGYNVSSQNLRHRFSGTNYTFIASEGIFKYLIRKDSNNMKLYLNGTLEHTITTLPTGTGDLELLGGKVYKTLLFPTALSDSECIALTTI